MVKKLLFLILFTIIPLLSYADPITYVDILPIQEEVSFSTVTLDLTSWETCPTIELRGRKSVRILNTSTSENVYLAQSTGSTVWIRLYPKQDVYFEVTSDIHIYASCNTAETTIEIIEMR